MRNKIYGQIVRHAIVAVVVLMVLAPLSLLAQNDNIFVQKGKIVDIKGNPIVGAIINVSEKNTIAVSDKLGYFNLKKVLPNDELTISCLGYKMKTAQSSKNEEVLITLEDDGGYYNRYVSLPYQSVKRKLNMASTSVVSGSELEKHPVTVLENALMGSVTGVETYEFNSEPGWSTSEKYIRGLRTTNSSARSPLVIIDNMERDLSFLDAFPIDNITILKDAAAAAIYGMRGANGVIFVTTKRGTPGKTKISVTQEVGYQMLAGMPMNLNSYDYAMTVNRAMKLDDATSVKYSDKELEYYKQAANGTLDPALQWKYPNTNWRKEILRELSPVYRTNLSISGGDKSTRYFVSLSYLRQEGVYNTKWTEWKDSGIDTQHRLNRFNLRSNIDIDVTKNLNLSLDLGGRLDDIKQPRASTWDMFTWSAELHPNVPILTPKGDFTQIMDNDYQTNPAARIAMSGLEQNRRRNIYTNVKATEKLDFITSGLSAYALIGFDAYNTFQLYQDQNYDAFWYDASMDANDPAAYTRRRTYSPLSTIKTNARDMSYNVNTTFSLDYNRVFADKHAVNGFAQIRTYKGVIPGYVSSTRYLSFNGMLNYVYNDKLSAQVVGSYMGNDNYEKGNRFGFFPGATVGYVISEEDFLKSSSIVDLLKVRASIGRAGQNTIGSRRYPYQNEFQVGTGYNFGTSQSYNESISEVNAGNTNIKWELSDMVNAGVDFDLFKGRIYGSVDVFKEWRSNILVSRSTVPDLYGITIPQDSYGKAETKGLEVSLGHKNKFGDFGYNIDANLTYNVSKIVDIDEIKPLYSYQAVTGQKIGQNMVYIFEKWFQSDEEIAGSPYQGTGIKPGNAKFKDINGDNVINQYDMVPHGYSYVPEIVTGLNIGFSWKGFEARALIVGELNRSVYIRENTDQGFFWNANPTKEVTNTWGYYTDDPSDPRNINAKYPRLSMKGSPNDRDNPRNQSTIWLLNGNFFSLRNVEVAYTLPQRLTAKLGMEKVRLYVTGYNIKTFSNAIPDGLDPEAPMNYIWQYPKTKTFSFGINVNF